MRPNFKFALIFSLFALLTFNACQQEAVEITQNQDEVLDPTSNVVNLMRSTSSNDVSADNIMDGTDCFSVNLPVTIIANGITITIDSLEDLALLEEIFNEFNDDDDVLEYLFPITIILNDYTEVVIENQVQLEAFIEECIEDEIDIIECVDFVYPISFSIFNIEFDFIETVTIHSDAELYVFLESLQEEAVIASLNYPVSMEYANGTTIEVNSNQELEAAINVAEEMCDDVNDACHPEEIVENLVTCPWAVAAFNNDNNYAGYSLKFFADGFFKIIDANGNIVTEGSWELSVSDQGHPELIITNLTDLVEDFSGSWIIVECDDNRYELVRETPAGAAIALVIEKDCGDQIDCSAQEIYHNLLECVWFGVTSLYDNVNAEVFNFHEDGTFSTQASGGNVVGTWNIELTDLGVILLLQSDVEPYNLLELEWVIIECSANRIKGINGDDYVVFEQDCENNSNPFECYDNVTMALCDDDILDGFTEFNLELVYPNCNTDEVEVRFYKTIADAENDVNVLSTVYTNVTNPQTIYAKVTLAGTTESQIFEVQLVVEDCSQGSCTEEELDAILMECHWKASNVNGSNDFIDFDIFFNTNQELVIEGNGTTITGNWITTGNPSDGVYLVISELEGNFAIFNQEWLVVECSNEMLHLQNGDSNLILERVCN